MIQIKGPQLEIVDGTFMCHGLPCIFTGVNDDGTDVLTNEVLRVYFLFLGAKYQIKEYNDGEVFLTPENWEDPNCDKINELCDLGYALVMSNEVNGLVQDEDLVAIGNISGLQYVNSDHTIWIDCWYHSPSIFMVPAGYFPPEENV
jgi:hypothetical protein